MTVIPMNWLACIIVSVDRGSYERATTSHVVDGAGRELGSSAVSAGRQRDRVPRLLQLVRRPRPRALAERRDRTVHGRRDLRPSASHRLRGPRSRQGARRPARIAVGGRRLQQARARSV